MDSRCTAIRADGERCERIVGTGAFCFAHDPANFEQRKRVAAQGGRSKGSGEVRRLKDQLATLYRDLRDGHLDPRRGGVLVQVTNAQLRAVDLERSVREQDELEARLRTLEGVS